VETTADTGEAQSLDLALISHSQVDALLLHRLLADLPTNLGALTTRACRPTKRIDMETEATDVSEFASGKPMR
jgi:hypothetical protein